MSIEKINVQITMDDMPTENLLPILIFLHLQAVPNASIGFDKVIPYFSS